MYPGMGGTQKIEFNKPKPGKKAKMADSDYQALMNKEMGSAEQFGSQMGVQNFMTGLEEFGSGEMTKGTMDPKYGVTNLPTNDQVGGLGGAFAQGDHPFNRSLENPMAQSGVLGQFSATEYPQTDLQTLGTEVLDEKLMAKVQGRNPNLNNIAQVYGA